MGSTCCVADRTPLVASEGAVCLLPAARIAELSPTNRDRLCSCPWDPDSTRVGSIETSALQKREPIKRQSSRELFKMKLAKLSVKRPDIPLPENGLHLEPIQIAS